MDNISVFGTEDCRFKSYRGHRQHMKNSKIKIIILSLSLIALPLIIKAAGLIPCGGKGEPPCQLCHLFVLLQNIINFILFQFVPPLAVLMIVIGGVMFFFAGGNPASAERAKQILTATIIGLVIIYASWMLVGTILSAIGLSDFGVGLVGPDKWFQINCPIQ